jgi:hypothetical protein
VIMNFESTHTMKKNIRIYGSVFGQCPKFAPLNGILSCLADIVADNVRFERSPELLSIFEQLPDIVIILTLTYVNNSVKLQFQ